MPKTGATLPIEQLLGDTAWVRSLAARLTDNSQDADDLAQDVWLAALQCPPRSPAPSLRSWTRAVLHKLAARQRRLEVRRSQREQVAAARHANAELGDELERVRLHHALSDAVLALDEPYRSAIVLRHFEGLSYDDLARRHGVSAAAARQRVSRGYGLLRARLSQQGVGRRQTLALVGGVEMPWALGKGLVGGWIMKTKALFAASAAGVVALAWCVLPSPPLAAPPGETAPPDPMLVTSTPEEHGAAVAAESDRTLLPRPDTGASTTEVALRLAVVTGFVRDVEHRPVAPPGTVRLIVRDPGGADHGVDGAIDASGQFRVEAPPGELVHAWARAKGHRALEVDLERRLAAGDISQLDLRLPRGAVVEGVVLDATTRTPLAGAEVWCEGMDYEPDSTEPTAVTDATGRFHLDGVDPDRHLTDDGDVLALVPLRAQTDRHAPAPLQAYAAPWNVDERYEFEILLDPAPCTVLGQVFETDDQTPAQGRLVHVVDARGNLRTVSTNRIGEFDIERAVAGPLHVFARPWRFHDRMGQATARSTFDLVPGTNRIRLTLREPTAQLSGRLLTPGGNPVPNEPVEIQLCFATPNLRVGIESFRTDTGPDGRFSFQRLPAATYEVSPRGDGVAQPSRVIRALAAGESVTDLDFVYGEAMLVTGTVHSATPASGALELQLRQLGQGTAAATTAPDADGAFSFEPVLKGDYDLVAVRGGEVVARQFVTTTGALGVRLSVR